MIRAGSVSADAVPRKPRFAHSLGIAGCLFASFVAPISVPCADAQPAPEARATALGGDAVVVDRFEFSYGLEHPDLPALTEVGQSTVRLARAGDVWYVAGAGTAESESLAQLPAGDSYGAEALQEVAQGVVRWFNARGIFGVWVMYPDFEMSSSAISDRRPAGDRTARLVIWASQVAEVRTLARGSRLKQDVAINNPKHQHLRAGSPLRPALASEQQGSLFCGPVLEEYLRELSRHPGRRVEASIASSGEPGKIVLDYLVNETKPWEFFSQIANTGTASTGEWRGRVGFAHNQLTNHDDVLNLDVISAPDLETYATFAAYRIPLLRPTTLFARLYGSFGDFLSSDATLQDLRFVGKNWLGGCEFSNDLRLPRGWILSSALGAEFVHYEIKTQISESTLGSGYSNFLIPHLSETLATQGDKGSVSATLRLETTVGGVENMNPTDGVPTLGRIGADANWTALRWNIDSTVYLDRLFVSREQATQFPVNELSLRTRGKILLRGDKLIPQVQDPVGGAFSVRGYPESVLAADEVALATLEYAFHLPCALKQGPAGSLFGEPFRWRATSSRQAPDWDLIFRAFFDYGRRSVSPSSQSSSSASVVPLIDRSVNLAGIGGGLELVVRHNLSIRCDVGLALDELRDSARPAGQQVVVRSGNTEVHLVSTFVW